MSDKGTVSAAKRVDPLRKQSGLPRAAIIERMEETFVRLTGATRGELTAEELTLAEDLVETKFTTEEWLHRVP
jgi:lipoate-protein ligase A